MKDERIAELEAKVKGYWASVNQDTVQEYVLAQINADLQTHIAELEAFVAAYDALAPAIHTGDNGKIVEAIAAKDAARKALEKRRAR